MVLIMPLLVIGFENYHFVICCSCFVELDVSNVLVSLMYLLHILQVMCQGNSLRHPMKFLSSSDGCVGNVMTFSVGL